MDIASLLFQYGGEAKAKVCPVVTPLPHNLEVRGEARLRQGHGSHVVVVLLFLVVG